MAENTLDSLNIEISSSADNAVKSLNGIISSLKKLGRIGKSGGLMVVQKQLKSIASIKFDKLNEQLAPLAGYIKELKSLTKTLSNTNITSPTVDFSTATASLDDTISDIEQKSEELQTVIGRFGKTSAAPDWFNDVRQECEKTVDSFSSFSTQIEAARDKLRELLNAKKDAFGDTSTFVGASSFATTINAQLQKLNLTAELLQDKFNKLSQTDGTPNKEKWYALEKAILSTKIQYQSLLRAIDKNAIAIDSMGDKAIKAQSKMSKLFSKLKNMLIYRLGYSIFHQISQMASEGLQNIAQYSEEANAILSEYKTEYLYLKNSIASTLLPFLQQILPIVIRIGDALVDVMNNVGIIIAKLNGESTFIKAKKYAQDYADTLAEVKRYTTGFDELNILGSSSDSSTDTSEMFETVDISGWDFAGAIAKITALVTAITALVAIFKEIDISKIFSSATTDVSKLWTYLKNVSGWKKGALSIAAVATEAVTCYSAFYNLTKGTQSLSSVLLEVIPTTVAVGAAMTAMCGSAGLVITAATFLISTIAGIISASTELRKEAALDDFFNVQGVAISEVTEAMDDYFQSIGLEKQKELNEKVAETTSNLIDARYAYNSLWDTLKNADSIDTTQLEELASTFSDLATAVNSLNSAAIESAMNSLKTGIEMNITPELTTKLSNLVSSLQIASDLLGTKVSAISTEYQSIINDIINGAITFEEAQPRLEELATELTDFTLLSDADFNEFETGIETAVSKAINAGFDEDSVKSAVSDLVDDKDTYLETITNAYKESNDYIQQLLDLQDKYGVDFGITEDAFDTLEQNYNAQVERITTLYSEALTTIYNGLADNMTELSEIEQWWGRFLANDMGGDIVTEAVRWLGNTFNWKSANMQAYESEYALLSYISNLIPAHANGGFVEDGLFMANHSELVGEFANGKTAVANNEQIIEGIKQGVIEAMSESGNNQGGDWTIQIVDEGGRVKSETIISALERKNRRDGKTVISIGG